MYQRRLRIWAIRLRLSGSIVYIRERKVEFYVTFSSRSSTQNRSGSHIGRLRKERHENLLFLFLFLFHTKPSNQNLIISIHSSPDSLGLCFVRGSPGMNIMQSIPTELLLHIEGGARWCQNMSEQCKPCLRARSKRLSLPFSSDLRFLPFC